TDGERVEGCTNFLWVVMIAALGLVFDDLIVPSRVLGFLLMTVAMGSVVWAARGQRWRDSAGIWMVALAMASMGPIAAWAAGGLEVSLITAGLGVAIALGYEIIAREGRDLRFGLGLGIVLSCLSLTRPDGTLFTASFCLGLVLARGNRRLVWKNAVVAGAMSTASFAALSVFRRLYYGAWVPNTSFKLLVPGSRLEDGWKYISRDHAIWSPLLLLFGLAIVVALCSPHTRRRVVLVIPSLLVWLTYVLFIGGDFMPQRRHWVPALFLFIAIAAEAVRYLVSVRGAALVAWYLTFATPALLLWIQRDDWAVADANNAHWYWTGRPIGLFFQAAFGPKDPLVAVDPAGSLPYFSKLRSLDMLGLNDRFLATHPPELTGKEQVGHELGNGAYVLERRPDIVVFRLPYGSLTPFFRSGKEMVALPVWQQEYQPFYYRTPTESVEGVAFLRHIGGPLAPRWEDGHLNLPLWLLATSQSARVTLDQGGQMQLILAKGAKAIYRKLSLEGSRCEVEIDATDTVELTVRTDSSAHVARPNAPTSFSTKTPTVSLEIKTTKHEGVLRMVEFACDT
ncbi:MAG TPA: hypothetical protein PK710_14665, partial [Polyangiaceae bacterium]|nr:hypothetical protein [Polyangiaceae bacterium]